MTTLIDTNGNHAAYYRYSPYGDPTLAEDNSANSGAANPWRYISGYYDIEGDSYTKLGARYTDDHSHFNQPDPKPGNCSDPLTTLNYAYAEGDPMNKQDPSGSEVDSAEACEIGGVGGAITGAFAGIGGGLIGVTVGGITGLVGGCVAGIVTNYLTDEANTD